VNDEYDDYPMPDDLVAEHMHVLLHGEPEESPIRMRAARIRKLSPAEFRRLRQPVRLKPRYSRGNPQRARAPRRGKRAPRRRHALTARSGAAGSADSPPPAPARAVGDAVEGFSAKREARRSAGSWRAT
jgi:hypothetical protein